MVAPSGSAMMDVRAIPVEIPAGDAVVLRGQRWGSGPDWIILLHETGEQRDLDDWRPLLPAIVTSDRTVLSIDLRGHGASDGTWVSASSGADLAALLAYAKTSGAAWVALAGAGDSATHILEFSSANPIDASILLSPVFGAGQATELRGRGEAKLFAVGSRTAQLNRDIRVARNGSIGWAMLVSMPTEAQGTHLLSGPNSGQIIERIVSFLAEQRMLARHRLPHREGTPLPEPAMPNVSVPRKRS